MPSRALIALSLLFTVFLWGGNNAGIKFLVGSWPPLWVGATRFLCAGLLMLAFVRGGASVATHRLWRGGLALAVYIAVFNWAIALTAVSHVALYLAASPVWALAWEGREGREKGEYTRRFSAAGLALFGVGVLLWPALQSGDRFSWTGECLGLASSFLWVAYGRQCRALGATLSGAAVSAHTMWRAGVWLLPFGLLEIARTPLVWESRLFWVQLYCIIFGGVVAFGLWNRALRHWRTSEVYLFNNLIPVSTMLWAYFCLDEPMASTFWLAVACIAAGVALAQRS